MSVASGSFDSFVSNRFKGIDKSQKKENIGFRTPSEIEFGRMINGAVELPGNIFQVPSAKKEDIFYTVDMTIGICDFPVGKDGSPCKHQYVLWVTKTTNSPNFLPIFDTAEKKKFSFIAIGKTCDASMYEGLHDRVTLSQAPIAPLDPDEVIDIVLHNESPEQFDGPLQIIREENTMEKEAKESLKSAFSHLNHLLQSADKSFFQGAIKFAKRVEKMTTNQITSALHQFGSCQYIRKKGHSFTSTVVRRAQKRKIHVQPEAVKRRKKSSSKGRGELKKGGTHNKVLSNIPVRQMQGKKRVHNISENVRDNKPVSKKAGRTMLSKTKTVLVTNEIVKKSAVSKQEQ